jgi:hypothetical protein
MTQLHGTLTHCDIGYWGCSILSGRANGGDADTRSRSAGCRDGGLQWKI